MDIKASDLPFIDDILDNWRLDDPVSLGFDYLEAEAVGTCGGDHLQLGSERVGSSMLV
jgi:hypothetical protein